MAISATGLVFVAFGINEYLNIYLNAWSKSSIKSSTFSIPKNGGKEAGPKDSFGEDGDRKNCFLLIKYLDIVIGNKFDKHV